MGFAGPTDAMVPTQRIWCHARQRHALKADSHLDAESMEFAARIT